MMILVTILCYFAVLLLIARITGRKGGSNAAFFKGENQSPWYIVSFGMIGASISGVTFVSVPGMVRGMDMTYMQTVLGFFFGYMAVAHILLPLYYKLNLTSIYGYLGTRIGVRAYRTGSFFFLLSRMLGTAAKLYLVCLILHTYVFQEMHVPFWLIAVGSVALVWIYTHKSGIKTIVWTDTLQTFCLIAALVFIIYFTIQRLDLNFSGIVQTIQNSEHSRIFVFDDWVSRQNFFKQFFSGIFIVIVMTGLDQDMMQKNLSCRNLREAQKNMYCYGFSFIPLNFLFLCLGGHQEAVRISSSVGGIVHKRGEACEGNTDEVDKVVTGKSEGEGEGAHQYNDFENVDFHPVKDLHQYGEEHEEDGD